MFIHPQTHLEIARQRHEDLLVEADRRRLAKASEGLGCIWPARQSSASTSRTQRDSDGVFTGGPRVKGTATHFGHREAGGVVVDVFWDRGSLVNEFRVEVEDRRDGARFVLYPQTGREAIQAFRHPFAAARAALNGKAWAA
jgi:hypothetical protein